MAAMAGRGTAFGSADEPSAAVRAEPVRLARRMSADQASQLILLSCIRHVRPNAALLPESPDPEVLHQARVALRRLRCALKLFAHPRRTGPAGALRSQLRGLAAALGEARDLDVLLEHPPEGAVLEQLEQQRVAAHAAAARYFLSAEWQALQTELARFVLWGKWLDAAGGRSARKLAAQCLSRLRRKLRRQAGALTCSSDEDRHELRKTVKALRYAAGFFESLYSGPKRRPRLRQQVAVLENLQDQLGALNDLATRRRIWRRFDLTETAVAQAAGQPEMSDAVLRKASAALARLERMRPFWR